MAQPRFVHNEPGRFDCRFTSVTIKDCPSIVLKGMEGKYFRSLGGSCRRKGLFSGQRSVGPHA